MYYHSGTSFFIGGLHHAAARISGDNVYKHLKYEGGIHRVQRIPEVGLSSRMQRIHTGTMSVIVLPHPDEVTPCRNPVPLSVKIHRSFTVHEKLLCVLLTECFCTPNMWTSFPPRSSPSILCGQVTVLQFSSRLTPSPWGSSTSWTQPHRTAAPATSEPDVRPGCLLCSCIWRVPWPPP